MRQNEAMLSQVSSITGVCPYGTILLGAQPSVFSGLILSAKLSWKATKALCPFGVGNEYQTKFVN